jgi:hypothetical protein
MRTVIGAAIVSMFLTCVLVVAAVVAAAFAFL